MLSRLRLALRNNHGGKLGGAVDADETYIGGAARNMHFDKKKRVTVRRGRSIAGKVAVMGLLQRHGMDGAFSLVRVESLSSLSPVPLTLPVSPPLSRASQSSPYVRCAHRAGGPAAPRPKPSRIKKRSLRS